MRQKWHTWKKAEKATRQHCNGENYKSNKGYYL